MKTVTVRLGFLDKIAAVVIRENLPIILDNHPAKVIGNVRIFKNDNGQTMGELELEDNVDENLFFYYCSLNAEDGDFWFTGINLSTKLYPSHPTMRLKEKIIK